MKEKSARLHLKNVADKHFTSHLFTKLKHKKGFQCNSWAKNIFPVEPQLFTVLSGLLKVTAFRAPIIAIQIVVYPTVAGEVKSL